ncbi:MAG TPA: ABC transporter, partial [Lachnospiraceae bacterium]|nr:ABC transporter [Lachnospiraceae bacterium]
MPITIDIQKKLQNLNLQIKWSSSARRIAILGASGAGKSMTLKMIAGIETPDRGKIIADGRTLFDSGRKINVRTQERGTGYLFQNYALFPNMTVRQNITIAGKAARSGKEALVQDLIRRFELEGLENSYPVSLSGGQQQRTALARILASAPEMILLDEPFSALDSSLRDKMQLELEKNLADFPGTVILVT